MTPEPDVELESHDGRLEARFLGDFTVERFARQVEIAVRACREQGFLLLLIDTSALSGLPSTIERFQMGQHGAAAAADLTRVAVLARPEQIDPQKIGVLVAQNRGLKVDVFNDRAEAVDWLLGRMPPTA